MKDFFSNIRRINDEVEYTEKENNFIETFFSQNDDITKKLDFNVDYMNDFLLKNIREYYFKLYTYSMDELEFMDADFKNRFEQKIKKEKMFWENTLEDLKITDAELVHQEIDSINYVSFIDIKIVVEVEYEVKNILVGNKRKRKEKFKEVITFNHQEIGWVVFNTKDKKELKFDEVV